MINYDWEKEYVAKHSISYSEYLAEQIMSLVDRNISYTEYLSSVYDGKNIKRKEKIKKLFK